MIWSLLVDIVIILHRNIKIHKLLIYLLKKDVYHLHILMYHKVCLTYKVVIMYGEFLLILTNVILLVVVLQVDKLLLLQLNVLHLVQLQILLGLQEYLLLIVELSDINLLVVLDYPEKEDQVLQVNKYLLFYMQGYLLKDLDVSMGFITRSVDDLTWLC